ncbi:MAG: HlyD family secretion protein, partial [Limisphaerales bacterium]
AGARRRKVRWGRLALIIVPILIIGAALYYWFFMRPYESTDDAFIAADVVPIASQVAGRVAQLFVADNQHVTNGEPLLEIDPRDYEAKVAQAQANLVAARTRLEQAKAQVTSDEAKVEQEQASLVAAQTDAQRAEADLRRYQAVEGPAVARTQYDLAVAQARSTEATVNVAKSRVKAAQVQIQLSQAAVRTAEADVHGNQALLRQAELELSYTKLNAPDAGFVTHRTINTGAYVQVGQDLLALVPARVYVIANFKETQLTHMRPGQRVEVSVDAYPGHTFKAHVNSIQRGSGSSFSVLPPENATGNYVKVVQRVPVKIVFDEPPNPKLPLGPGLSVEPTVNVLGKGDAGTTNQVAAAAGDGQ